MPYLRGLRALRGEIIWILAVTPALWLSGCMVGPDYQRTPVTAPGVFRGSSATAPDPLSIAELKWFEVFKDQELQELIRTALLQNYDLRDAIARVEAARANLGITQADQYPNFGVGADVTAIEASRRGAQTIPRGIGRERTFTTVFLNLFTFELDIWGRLRRATESARAQLLATDWNRKTVITTLVSDVATAYFNLLELDMELAIAKNTLFTRQESLRLIKVQQQGGVATLLDVRQGEQLVYAAAEVIPNAERQIEQTENQISLLLGKNPGAVTRSRLLTEQQTPPEVPPGLPSSLLERRPDIQAAEQILIAANANIGVAKAACFPRITLTGELGFQSTALSNLFSGSRRLWTFVPQLTYPIFDAGRIRSGVELAEAEQRSALAQYEKAIQTGFRDVSDALVQYQKVREIRGQRELLVASLQQRKRLAYMRYEGGVDTLLNALDADRDLFNAELSLAQIRLSELLSLVQLYKALGGGWQE
ncbi:MAG TPA: efflux transporter outer membrane subunit [Candidatus Binatia bacterium]|nr:efflux transporter outer membrane subunit [Candidatus Binatia bacterium]